MARSGDTTMAFNEDFFVSTLNSPKVEKLVDAAAEQVQTKAKSSARVDSGDYRDKIHTEHKQAKYRRVTQVVASDPVSLIEESKTGNLARALKAAKIK